MKASENLHNLCIAAIKRSYIPPFNFIYTKIYKISDTFEVDGVAIELKLNTNEFPLCPTIINTKV